MTDRTELIVNRREECIFNGEVSQDGVFKIFNLAIDYLNMQSIKEYSDEKNITPQAVYKKKLKIFHNFGIKLIYE